MLTSHNHMQPPHLYTGNMQAEPHHNSAGNSQEDLMQDKGCHGGLPSSSPWNTRIQQYNCKPLWFTYLHLVQAHPFVVFGVTGGGILPVGRGLPGNVSDRCRFLIVM